MTIAKNSGAVPDLIASSADVCELAFELSGLLGGLEALHGDDGSLTRLLLFALNRLGARVMEAADTHQQALITLQISVEASDETGT